MPLQRQPLSIDSSLERGGQDRDHAFDLLRGGAVIFIVAYYHIESVWMMTLPSNVSGWLARIALAMFCFISGYLLASRTKISCWRELGNFYQRRLWRIYPPYLVALIAFVALGLVHESSLVPSVLLINTLIDCNLLTLWFISMIFVFYILTPLFLFRPGIRKTICLALFILTDIILLRIKWQLPDARLLPNFLAFALGLLAAQSKAAGNCFLRPTRWVFWTCLPATTCVAMASLGHWPADASLLDAGLISALFVTSLPPLMVVARSLAAWLPARMIHSLSHASFMLYLFHRVIYHWGEPYAPVEHDWPRNLYNVALLFPLTLGISWVLQTGWDALVAKAGKIVGLDYSAANNAQ